MILEKFISNFTRRLDAFDKSNISEDSMRYDFFAACLHSGLSTEKILLENLHDHSHLSKREVDLVLHTEMARIAFEFKYFKQVPSKKDDSTSYMAKFVVDLLKLKHFSNNVKAKYFIFATDELMYNYIGNPRNGFSKLHTSRLGENFEISAGDKSGYHFRKIVSGVIPDELSPFSTNITLKKITYRYINKQHYIGCFRVLS